MKNLKIFVQIVAVFAILLTSCGKEENSVCSDEEIGELKLSERAKGFTTYTDAKKYKFIDQRGRVLVFENTSELSDNTRIDVEKTGEREGYFGGVEECHDYYKTYRKEDVLLSTDGEYRLLTQAFIEDNISSIDSPKERIKFALVRYSYGTGGVAGVYHLDSGEGEFGSVVMKTYNSLILNGKTFNNVLSFAKEQDGMTSTLYIKEGTGIIGFKNDGDTFSLK